MKIEKYPLKAEDSFMVFEFVSEGPKGIVPKLIKFSETNLKGFYNLGFGDWNDKWLKIDDLAKSNNGDTNKIFATIATTIMEFNKYYPDAIIFAKGSTSARTRKYQTEINKYLSVIEPVFEVFGSIKEQKWAQFQPGINYLSFIAIPKKL